MNDADRYRLRFGPYKTPKCKVGKFLTCVVRGEKKVVALSDAPTPWPMTQHDTRKGCGRPYVIVCGDLVKAVQRESAQAVAHWWGVSKITVWQWRKALGVRSRTEGDLALARDWFPEKMTEEVVAKRMASLKSPERAEKIAASKQGKKRPPHVGEAVRRANLGRPFSEERRAKLREAVQRRGGGRPPGSGTGELWTAEEDKLVRTLPPAEAMAKTGRSRAAVFSRRRTLGLVTVGRGVRWTPEEDEMLRTMSIKEAMESTGRSRGSVEQRRWLLGTA